MNGLHVVSLKIHRKSRSAGEQLCDFVREHPGCRCRAGAAPLPPPRCSARAQSRDSASPASRDTGRQRRAQRASRWQLLHSPTRKSKYSCPAKTHLIRRPPKPFTKTKQDKSCVKYQAERTSYLPSQGALTCLVRRAAASQG